VCVCVCVCVCAVGPTSWPVGFGGKWELLASHMVFVSGYSDCSLLCFIFLTLEEPVSRTFFFNSISQRCFKAHGGSCSGSVYFSFRF